MGMEITGGGGASNMGRGVKSIINRREIMGICRKKTVG